MNKMLIILAISCISIQAFAFDHTHVKWSEVLKKYQNNQGYVSYKKLKEDISLDRKHDFYLYLTEIQAVKQPEYDRWTNDEKKAFLINSYNALTFKLIVEHYPVASIKKIGGFFTKPWSIEFFSLLDGRIKKLDPIEHEWLRPTFKDYRIHAAVNCASVSCPPLRNEAFVPPQLEAQLDDQMKLWLNDKTRNQISYQKKVFKISKIFDWYKADFEDWGGGVAEVIGKYVANPLRRDVSSQIKVQYLPYNWDLNEAK